MSAATAAVLYASVISTSTATNAVPEDVKDKQHHRKEGKGFMNPWESFLDRSFFKILSAMLRYVEVN